MKERKLLKQIAMCFMFAVIVSAFARPGIRAEAAAAVRNGWHEGKYYENGKRARGWKTRKGKTYYFKKDGSCTVGIGHIKKDYYLFSAQGVLIRDTKTIEGTTYYINSRHHLEVYSKGNQYFRASGEEMDKMDVLDFVTFLRAKKIASQLTKPSMSSAAKLKKCFQWVRSHGYHMRRRWKWRKNWPALYANDHFQSNGGCCRSDGSAFAYLARALGYTNVYVCTDGVSQLAHCWTEINGKVYDPLFVERRFSKYYGASYKTCGLHKSNATPVAIGYEP